MTEATQAQINAIWEEIRMMRDSITAIGNEQEDLKGRVDNMQDRLTEAGDVLGKE